MCGGYLYTVSVQSHTPEDAVQRWLYERKITDTAIERFSLVWDNTKITIPIRDTSGVFLFNKYRYFSGGAKYKYDAGSSATLFGTDVARGAKKIIITEGEFDAIALYGAGYAAVSGTGGCGTWRKEWADMIPADAEIIICYDNDDAGMRGAVHLLSYIPNAKVVFVPNEAGIKDITDYLVRGGNVKGLFETAQHFVSLEEVEKDELRRTALWQSTTFHEEWKKRFAPPRPNPIKRKPMTESGDAILRAKQYSIENLVSFGQSRKTKCVWHKESTASLHYYPETNTVHCFGACAKSGDAIDVYRALYGVSFAQAVSDLNTL